MLETTQVMQQVLRRLKEEPACILGEICQEYRKTGQPVPDHHLHIAGYLGEASLKALLAVGLIERKTESRMYLYAYQPTEKGLEQCQRLGIDSKKG